MEEISYCMETPIKDHNTRPTAKITTIANNPQAVEPFSFRADQQAMKHYISDLDSSLEAHKPNRQEYTERKIKLVSISPQQRTEKKRYIKLLTPFSGKGGEGDDESVIADERSHEVSFQAGLQEVRASLNYFDETLNQMNTQLQGLSEIKEIEEEQRIAMFSQTNSKNQLQKEENQHRQEEPIKHKRKIILSINRNNRPPHNSQQYIKESFRYCIGCQIPVLEANIILHQRQCAPFQQIFRMDYPQISELLKAMIAQLASRIDCIKSSLSEQDLSTLKLYTQGLLYQSELMGEEKSGAYRMKLQSMQQVGKKWVDLAEEVCKLNWFITLRENITKKHLT